MKAVIDPGNGYLLHNAMLQVLLGRAALVVLAPPDAAVSRTVAVQEAQPSWLTSISLVWHWYEWSTAMTSQPSRTTGLDYKMLWAGCNFQENQLIPIRKHIRCLSTSLHVTTHVNRKRLSTAWFCHRSVWIEGGVGMLLKRRFRSLKNHTMDFIRDTFIIMLVLVSISDETLPGGKDSETSNNDCLLDIFCRECV